MKSNVFRRRPSGPYSGRLAFDPEAGFHLAENGRRVVTTDGGKTWRYAVRGDASHNARYSQRRIEVAGTTEADAHHFGPTADDPHHAGELFDPDETARTVTSHTEAYR